MLFSLIDYYLPSIGKITAHVAPGVVGFFSSFLSFISFLSLHFIHIAYLCSDILTGRLVGGWVGEGGGRLLKVTHEAINVWIRQDAE